MRFRFIAPAGTPIPAGVLAAWAGRIVSRRPQVAALSAMVCRTFGLRACLPVHTGRAALVLVLRALARLGPSSRNEVVIPSYTCYTGIAAVLAAGLEPRIVDNDPEEVEAAGFGGSRRQWLVRVSPLGGGQILVRLIDRSEARAAEQMRVDFVANASHELRTPLSTLIGYTETLRERTEELDGDTQERFLSIVHDEARRMQRVVEDLISLSRI